MKLTLYLLSFCFIWITCDSTGVVNYDEIDSTIVLGFNEIHSSENTEPELHLGLATIDHYPCINYRIVTENKFSSKRIHVKVLGSTIGNICATALGPATTIIPINYTNGVYELVLEINSKEEIFELRFNDDSLELIRIVRRGYNFLPHIFIQNSDKWYKYPVNSFALVGGTNTNNTHLYENFLKQLKSNFSIREFTFDEDGVIPYPDSGSGHWVDFPSSFFTYESDAQFEEIGQSLINYSIENITPNTGVGFSLYNWKNQSFHSWITDN